MIYVSIKNTNYAKKIDYKTLHKYIAYIPTSKIRDILCSFFWESEIMVNQ